MSSGPPSNVKQCVSRVDIFRPETCRFSPTPSGFVQAYSRALSDVTHSAFGLLGLRCVYEVFFTILRFGIPKRVNRLVHLDFEQKGLFGIRSRHSVPSSLTKGPSRRFEASGKGVGFGSPSHSYTCLSRVYISRVEKRRWFRFSWTPFGFVHAR